jgi:hypothetical protein
LGGGNDQVRTARILDEVPNLGNQSGRFFDNLCAPKGQNLLGHGLANLDSLFRLARRDACQVRSQLRVEGGLLLRIENDGGVVAGLGGRRLLRGATRAVDVREVRGIRPVDGVDGVIHGHGGQLRSVAVWKMEGYTNAEIADKLGCVPVTVERKLQLIRSLWANEREL